MDQRRQKIHHISGDGNCLYRSVLVSARAHKAWPSEARLRKLDTHVAAILRNEQILVPINMFKATDALLIIQFMRYACIAAIIEDNTFVFSDQSRSRCIQETVQMGSFADHIQIKALARALRVNIVIFHEGKTVKPTLIPCTSSLKNCKNFPFLPLRRSHEHFDAIVPN